MHRIKIEMGSNYTFFTLVGWILNWCKIVNFEIIRHYYHTAGMLSCGLLDSDYFFGQSLFLYQRPVFIQFFEIRVDQTQRVFFRISGYGPSPEGVIFAKHLFYKTVSTGLIKSGKIQIYIRLFITVKTQESFKGYVVPVTLHVCSAIRTTGRRQIISGTKSNIIYHFIKFTFRTKIMWSQRIHLSYADKCCYKRGTNRSSGTYDVTVFI